MAMRMRVKITIIDDSGSALQEVPIKGLKSHLRKALELIAGVQAAAFGLFAC